jgi:hypothetical protein
MQKLFPQKPPLLAQIANQSACYQPLVSFWKTWCLTRYNAFSILIGKDIQQALTQMIDDWLTEIDDKNIVRAVLLDFSMAFYMIYYNLLLLCYGFTPPAILGIKKYCTCLTLFLYFCVF